MLGKVFEIVTATASATPAWETKEDQPHFRTVGTSFAIRLLTLRGDHREEDAARAERERDGPELLQERNVEVRARVREEHHEDHRGSALDGVQELGALIGQVLDHEAGGQEAEQRVDVHVLQELGEAEANREQDEQEVLADEPQVGGEHQAERRADGDAADDVVTEVPGSP